MKTLSLIISTLGAISLAVSTPVVERACTAYELWDTGFVSTYVVATAHNLQPATGKSVTATIVIAATCQPYTSSSPALITLTGTAKDRDYQGDPAGPSPTSTVTVRGSNSVTFTAAVPNGAKNLDLIVTGNFTPGGLDNYNYIVNQLGVVYTFS